MSEEKTIEELKESIDNSESLLVSRSTASTAFDTFYYIFLFHTYSAERIFSLLLKPDAGNNEEITSLQQESINLLAEQSKLHEPLADLFHEAFQLSLEIEQAKRENRGIYSFLFIVAFNYYIFTELLIQNRSLHQQLAELKAAKRIPGPFEYILSLTSSNLPHPFF